jgi:hypothetical protein
MKVGTKIGLFAALAALVLMPGAARAGIRSALVREAAESIIRKLGKEAGKEGSEVLVKKLDTLAVRHGMEAMEAVQRVGPGAVTLIEEAGEHGAVAARLLARHGEQAVALVTSRKSLALVARHGDVTAEALLKHPGVATLVIEALGEPGIRALNALSKREGRRLAQLLEESWFSQTGRAAEVLAVVERFGDRAMDFIWRHKGALTVASVLAAFLTDRASFLDGTKRIAHAAADTASGSLTAVPKPGSTIAAIWMPLMVLFAILFVMLLRPTLLRCLRSRRASA